MLDKEIVGRCKENDRTAQMQLYRKYCEGMFVVASRYVTNASDAEDIMQEAFIKAFRSLNQYRGEVAFGAWLKKIVINKALDHIKARKKVVDSIEDKHELIESGDDQSWDIEPQITVQDVKRAIQELSDIYRYVLQLYLIDGYDHVEIAQILNIPATTCRSRLMRGREQLKKQLTNN